VVTFREGRGGPLRGSQIRRGDWQLGADARVLAAAAACSCPSSAFLYRAQSPDGFDRGSGAEERKDGEEAVVGVGGLVETDIYEARNAEPLFYPAKPPAQWLMVAEVAGEVLVVLLAPSDSGDPTRCRPIGCYLAAKHLADRYREVR
jgi:hypothetical protein